MWTGVRIRDVVEYLGIRIDEQKYVTNTGGDPLPEGIETKKVIVERSIPIQKGLQDSLLARGNQWSAIASFAWWAFALGCSGIFWLQSNQICQKISFTTEQSQKLKFSVRDIAFDQLEKKEIPNNHLCGGCL